MTNLNWSARLLNMFLDDSYAIGTFPNWLEVAYKRHWSVYHRWYGL